MTITDTAFALIDVQGRLAQLMHDRDSLFANLEVMVQAVRILEIPVVWAEQNPGKMGETIPQLGAHLQDLAPSPKMSFSCCGDPVFVERLDATRRKTVLVAGIEAHVCVYQTVRDLLAAGFLVQVVADAVSSRTAANRQLGLERMSRMGAELTTTEMAIFELLRTAEHPRFRDILRLVK